MGRILEKQIYKLKKDTLRVYAKYYQQKDNTSIKHHMCMQNITNKKLRENTTYMYMYKKCATYPNSARDLC